MINSRVRSVDLRTRMHGQEVLVTLFLGALLGIVFLRGFKEAIGIAVVLVAVYLLLNLVVILVAIRHVAGHAALITDWWAALTGLLNLVPRYLPRAGWRPSVPVPFARSCSSSTTSARPRQLRCQAILLAVK